MRVLRRFFIRLWNFTTGRRADERLQEEMAEHLDLQTEEYVRAGLSPVEARRRAVLKLGAMQAVREQHHAERGLPLAEDLLLDIRYAFRILLRSPGFSLTVIATIALGVGATTAIYSVVDATLLHPLPYPHPGELVRIEANLPGVGAHDIGMSIPELRDLQDSGLFQYVSLSFFGTNNLTGSNQPESIASKSVSPTYFAVLGVDAQLGRTFDPHDATPGFNNEVVISDGLWRRAFGADPHILGKVLRLDNDPAHVVGVMAAGFRDQGQTSEERGTDLWAAGGFADDPAPKPTRSTRLPFETVARLKPGLSPEAAQGRLDALVASLKKEYPADYPSQGAWTLKITPLAESLVGNVRQPLLLLLGAVGLVLLISCVNVANLLLARAGARGREMAVRQALGVARVRLVRQLLTESLLLFVLGGVSGFAVLFCARKILLRLIPESLPRLNDISISWGVLAFAILVSVAAGTIFGLAPAWITSRLHLNTTLRQEGRGSGGSRQRSRLRHGLVIGELAFSLMLMVAACLLLRSFWDLFKVQPGFNSTRVTAVETSLPNPNDPKTDVYRTGTQEGVLLHEVLRRIRAIPGVEETAVSDQAAIPLGHGQRDLRVAPLVVEGREVRGSQPALIDTVTVSPEYFHTLGMTLLRGRLFADQDIETTPLIAVVNQAAARLYWPGKDGKGEDPVGKRVHLLGLLGDARPEWTTIVGVIADARTESLADSGIPQMYLDIYQARSSFSRSICVDRSIPPLSPRRCGRRSRRSIRSFPSTARRRWTMFSLRRFLCGGSPWRWWRCLRDSSAACRAWDLRNYLFPGQRAVAGDCHSLCAGRAKTGCSPDGAAPGPSSGRGGRRLGTGWRVCCFASHGEPALRCLALRSLYFRRCHGCAQRRRRRRQLHSSDACHAPGSDHFTPVWMTMPYEGCGR